MSTVEEVRVMAPIHHAADWHEREHVELRDFNHAHERRKGLAPRNVERPRNRGDDLICAPDHLELCHCSGQARAAANS